MKRFLNLESKIRSEVRKLNPNATFNDNLDLEDLSNGINFVLTSNDVCSNLIDLLTKKYKLELACIRNIDGENVFTIDFYLLNF